ncbi:MAG TPA: tyrosine-type recombinase/integrase [Bryobacteraceae bacterium]|nr:tyrosine-type recombinase/integrase [Bryobacteraceae bacterium]
MTDIDVIKTAGRALPRAKFQRGTLKQVLRREAPGKRVKCWQARYLDYSQTNSEGKPKHRRVWLGKVAEMTKSAAQKKLDGKIADALSPEPIREDEPTFERWWARWKKLKEPMWSAGSQRNVLPTFDNHVLPKIGHLRVTEITRDVLQQLVNDLASRYSKSLVHTARTYLKATFEDAVEDDLISKNPARKIEVPPSRKKPDETYLSSQQIQALAAQLFGRDHLMFRLLVVCGLRPGELFALRRNDCDAEFGRLRIDETVYEGAVKEPKTEESASVVFVPSSLAQELQMWLDSTKGEPDDWMFPSNSGEPFRHASYLKWVLKPAAKRAGIPRVDLRMLRRSCATLSQRHATVKDTQTQLRHKDPAVTLGIYQKAIPESVQVAFTALDETLFPEASAGAAKPH